MPLNPLLRISHHPDFSIPVYLGDDATRSYLDQLRVKFMKIEKFLTQYDKRHFEPSLKENVLIKVRGIQQGLLGVIKEYLKGHPSRAYSLFSQMLDAYGVGDEIKSEQQYQLPKNSFLFRMQKQYEAGLKKKYINKTGFLKAKAAADLFHPPFQRRRAVSTNRFSIAGYPCLYLSETLITSYSECFPEKSADSRFNAICLKNSRPLYFIDLSENKLTGDPLSFGGFFSRKTGDPSIVLDNLGIFHLVMTTHTKVTYKPVYKGETFYFKAEYIIPQLLLQWAKLEGYAIDGIRYKSCTGAKRFPGTADHYNYVIPVKSDLQKGFCPVLTHLFRISPVYSYYSSSHMKDLKKSLLHISAELKDKKAIAFKKK